MKLERYCQWLTTAPNPRVRGYGADDGQRGWRVHAVIAPSTATFQDLRNIPALCGLLPRHGWGMDLFVEEKCKRCVDAAAREAIRNL